MQAISAPTPSNSNSTKGQNNSETHADRPTELRYEAEAIKDIHAVALRIVEHSFPIEFVLAGELAQMETFAIPRIAKLLHRTRQYEDEGVKRLDDTKATMYSIFTKPAGHKDREQMITHLNWVHSHYDIHNDDNIYTLIRMFLHPIEWIEKWGRRPLNENEKQALAGELNVIAKQMKIENMPVNYKAMQAWQQKYREQNQTYHPDNLAVSEGMIRAIEQHFPRVIRPLIKPTVLTLLDNETLIEALGFKAPSLLTKALVKTGITSWKYASRLYNPWSHRKFSNGWFVNYYPSYANEPGGFNLCKVGPKKLLTARDKQEIRCPFH